jgi:cell division protein FtsL
MNSAAKHISQSIFFQGQMAEIRLSSISLMHIALIIAVLLSSLAVVYVTNVHRITFSQLELAENRYHQLELKWGRLLLEQASLATPYRVESIATLKLSMQPIDNSQIHYIRTNK